MKFKNYDNAGTQEGSKFDADPPVPINWFGEQLWGVERPDKSEQGKIYFADMPIQNGWLAVNQETSVPWRGSPAVSVFLTLTGTENREDWTGKNNLFSKYNCGNYWLVDNIWEPQSLSKLVALPTNATYVIPGENMMFLEGTKQESAGIYNMLYRVYDIQHGDNQSGWGYAALFANLANISEGDDLAKARFGNTTFSIDRQGERTRSITATASVANLRQNTDWYPFRTDNFVFSSRPNAATPNQDDVIVIFSSK